MAELQNIAFSGTLWWALPGRLLSYFLRRIRGKARPQVASGSANKGSSGRARPWITPRASGTEPFHGGRLCSGTCTAGTGSAGVGPRGMTFLPGSWRAPGRPLTGRVRPWCSRLTAHSGTESWILIPEWPPATPWQWHRSPGKRWM